MITPTQAAELLTEQAPKAQDELIDSLSEEDVREILKVAVQLLWGEAVA